MIKNYFLVAWRNIRNNKAFSFINIVGLTLGMTCSLLILLWVYDERSIDGSHVHGDRLFQVYERVYVDGKVDAHYNTPAMLAAEMKRVIPEIKYASGGHAGETGTFEAGNKIIKEEGAFADSDYFKMFSYPSCKVNPSSTIGAKKRFGSTAAGRESSLGYGKRALYLNWKL